MLSVTYTTVGNKKEAERLAKILVDERLAACVNYFKIGSAYIWKGKTEICGEYALLCKTTKSKEKNLRERIRQLSSYEQPAVFSIITGNCDARYLNWVRESVK